MQISCAPVCFRIKILKKLPVRCKSAATKAFKKEAGTCISPRSPDQLSLNSSLEQAHYLKNAITDHSILEMPSELEESPRKVKILGVRNRAVFIKPHLKQKKIPINPEDRRSSIENNIKKVEHRACTPICKPAFSKKMKLHRR
jgi:hypothetical protein